MGSQFVQTITILDFMGMRLRAAITCVSWQVNVDI